MKRNLGRFLKLTAAIGLLFADSAAPFTEELHATSFTQTVATVPLRMGDFARSLSEKDIADIDAIAQASGGKPWLLEGPVGQIGFSIRVYLPPETQTRELRRGPTITLLKRPGDATWTRSGNQSITYAQVAQAGRDFNTITGDDDLNRPFAVSGMFDNADLVSLVAFIRSKPGNVEASWPIEFVGHPAPPEAEMVNVTLNQPNGSLLMLVRIKKQGSGWVLESARSGRA